LKVQPDEAFWDRGHLIDLIYRVHAAAAVQGGPARWPTPRSNSSDSCITPYRPARCEWGGQPVFRGIDDGETPVPRPASRREHNSLRVQVRALLYCNPETPCSVEEVANVLGLREGDVRNARPGTAKRVGRAIMAPFGHWLVGLRQAGLMPTWTDDAEPHPLAAVPRPQARTRPRSGQIMPLGGPGQRGSTGGR